MFQRCMLYHVCVLVTHAMYDIKNTVDPQIFFLPGSTETGVRIKIDVKALCKLSVQFSSVAQSCPTLCDPVDCSTPGLPVHHQLPEFTQTHVHWVGDAIQPSPPLLSPSPPTFNLSQHQGLFKWVSSSNQVAKVLEFQLQHQFFQWIFRTDFLEDGLLGSPCSPRASRVFPNTTVQECCFLKSDLIHSENPS